MHERVETVGLDAALSVIGLKIIPIGENVSLLELGLIPKAAYPSSLSFGFTGVLSPFIWVPVDSIARPMHCTINICVFVSTA